MINTRTSRLWLLVPRVLLLFPSTSFAVSIDWVVVGDPGNDGDPQPVCIECGPESSFGAVSYEFQIGRDEVSNAEYTEFLNAVAATDTNALYNTNMGSVPSIGGIARSGSPGSFTYSAIAGRDRRKLGGSQWGATVFVASEDEWHKAAYYKSGGTSAGYWDFPASSDTPTMCTTPGATANTANCDFSVSDLTR